MEKYAKYRSCNNIEKYANAIRVSYPNIIYREIREHNSRISLAQNIWRNTRIVLAYFTHMEYLEKYANCVGVFHSQGTYREILEHNSRAVNPRKGEPKNLTTCRQAVFLKISTLYIRTYFSVTSHKVLT